MTPINALTLSSPSPVQQTVKSVKHKNDLKQTNEMSAFSHFLESISPDHQIVGEGQQQGEMLKKLEETFIAFQELPKKTLSPEEIEVLSALLQMLSQQTTEMIDKLPENQPFTALFQQIDQELNDLTSFSTISFDGRKSFMGGEEKIFSTAPQNNSEEALRQLHLLVQQFDKEHQEANRLKQTEPIQKIFQEVTSLIQELASHDKVMEPKQIKLNDLKIEPSIQAAGNQIQQREEHGGVKLEQIQVQNNSLPITGAVAPVMQASQDNQQTEANPHPPVVRMNSFIEDLSEILKGIFRLRANPEGTQLRVNIFPEHLGHLDIHLTASEGKIAAQIFTSSLASKEALDLQVNQLRHSLMQQGISVDKIEITYQHSQQSFGQQHAHPEHRFSHQGQRQGISSRNGNAYHVMEEEAAAERNHLLDGSVKVNYTI